MCVCVCVQSLKRCVWTRGERPSVLGRSLCIIENPSMREAFEFSQTINSKWRCELCTSGPLQKKTQFPIRFWNVSLNWVLHCQKSQSSTSRWLRPDSRLAIPEGESCSRELSSHMMGDTGSKSSGNASEGRRLIWEHENSLEGNALEEAGSKLIFFLDSLVFNPTLNNVQTVRVQEQAEMGN